MAKVVDLLRAPEYRRTACHGRVKRMLDRIFFIGLPVRIGVA